MNSPEIVIENRRGEPEHQTREKGQLGGSMLKTRGQVSRGGVGTVLKTTYRLGGMKTIPGSVTP